MKPIDDDCLELWARIVAGPADEHRMFGGFRPVGRFAWHACLVNDGRAILVPLRDNTQFMVENEFSHALPDRPYFGVDEVIGEGETLESKKDILGEWCFKTWFLEDAA